ncbi:MAG TPA: hypothetical protein VNY84_14645 [Acidimicrobiales bacterium]|nr:hypothetical protein [Acidimicrobiales bacterium]
MLVAVEPLLFEEVGEAFRSLAPPSLGTPRIRARRYGLKVWYGSEAPEKEHYEVQVISATHASDATVLALEIGFHSEYQRLADNEAVLGWLMQHERRWHAGIGREAVAGAFLGSAGAWRRLSETWADPDLSDPGLVTELAVRLADYVSALESVRRRRETASTPDVDRPGRRQTLRTLDEGRARRAEGDAEPVRGRGRR